jgi:hypothetical protein
MTQVEALLVARAIQARVRTMPNGCMEWLGARSSAGYGLITRRALSKVPLSTHRVVWVARYGPIPKGQFVLHRCDNPPCVRLTHLFLGDDQVNSDDKIQKGRDRHRTPTGNAHWLHGHPEQHPRAKLTWADVEQIRQRDEPNGVLAAEFGVAKCTIINIKARRIWKTKS